MSHYHKSFPSTHNAVRSAAHNPRSFGIAMPSVQKVIQRVETIPVNKTSSQTLIDPGKSAGVDYQWNSSFVIYVYNQADETPQVKVVIYIETAANEKVFGNWNENIKSAWSNKFAIADEKGRVYPISVEIIRAPSNFKNYTVENVKQDVSHGVRGLFGTESMTKWGETDPQDIPHEVGHMLGNKDEYGTVDGKDWSAERNELNRDTYSIMYKGDEPPRIRHFNLIFEEVQKNGCIPKAKLIKMGGTTETRASSGTKTAPKKESGLRSGSGLSSFGNDLGKRLHEKRVTDITAYLINNITTMPKEQTDWFEKNNNWANDWDLSAAAKRILNM